MAQNSITDDIEAVSRVIGLPICCHDRLSITGIPGSLKIHRHPSCLKVKREGDRRCREFDSAIIHNRLARHPEGEIHQCPFGFTEIAVPILLQDAYAGVLFAGPCTLEDVDKAIISPIRIPNLQWLEDRLVVLRTLAVKIASELEGFKGKGDNRKSIVLGMIYKKLNCGIQLSDAAEELHLSPSRTGHLIKELFGETFPQLVNRIKMREAARMLSVMEKPVSEIAEFLGFQDQNYFSRAFKNVYEMCPREYRNTTNVQA